MRKTPKQSGVFWLLILMEDVARPSDGSSAKIFKLLCVCFLLQDVDWSAVLFCSDCSSSWVPVCDGKLLIGLSWSESTDYGILTVVLLWWRLLKTEPETTSSLLSELMLRVNLPCSWKVSLQCINSLVPSWQTRSLNGAGGLSISNFTASSPKVDLQSPVVTAGTNCIKSIMEH